MTLISILRKSHVGTPKTETVGRSGDEQRRAPQFVCLRESVAEAKLEEIKPEKGKSARATCLCRNFYRLPSHESGPLNRTLDPIGCLCHPVDHRDRRPTELPAGSSEVTGPQNPLRSPQRWANRFTLWPLGFVYMRAFQIDEEEKTEGTNLR